MNRILASKKSRERLNAQGLEAVTNTPAEFTARIQRETAVWAGVIREANIKAE
jgi:tripartite-type tricarboxylate transporter receptor subunit TctC